MQDALRKDLKANTVSLPDDMKEHAGQIMAVLTKVAGNLNVKNADDKTEVTLNKQVYLSPEFKELWGVFLLTR